MQSQDKHRADRPQTGAPATPAQPARSPNNDDCLTLLAAIRERVAGLVAPLANGHAPAGPPGYQQFANRRALDECDAALGQLLIMVSPQRGDAEQLVLDVAELRIVVSGAHKRL